MWYEAVAKDGTRSIGVAVSSNGISDWKRRDRQAFCMHCHIMHAQLCIHSLLFNFPLWLLLQFLFVAAVAMEPVNTSAVCACCLICMCNARVMAGECGPLHIACSFKGCQHTKASLCVL